MNMGVGTRMGGGRGGSTVGISRNNVSHFEGGSQGSIKSTGARRMINSGRSEVDPGLGLEEFRDLEGSDGAAVRVGTITAPTAPKQAMSTGLGSIVRVFGAALVGTCVPPLFHVLITFLDSLPGTSASFSITSAFACCSVVFGKLLIGHRTKGTNYACTYVGSRHPQQQLTLSPLQSLSSPYSPTSSTPSSLPNPQLSWQPSPPTLPST